MRWERLTPEADPEADFLYVVYEVDGSSCQGDRFIRHSGREYGLVLSGALEVTVGFDTYELGPGDSICFDSTVPHCLRTIGSKPVHGVWFVIGRQSDARAAALGSSGAGADPTAARLTRTRNRPVRTVVGSHPPTTKAPTGTEDSPMLKATDGLLLPTTIIGSLPRPSWYTENLGTRSFLDAMVDIGFREQYVDALSVYLREQELAGLDVVTDGDCRFDHDVGGQSWTRYPTQHMSGFDASAAAGQGGRRRPRVPEGPHPPRLPRGSRHAEDRRARRSRGAPVRRDVEGGAAADDATGQVRHGHAGARRLRRPGLALRGPSVADHGHQRRPQRGAARARRRRLPRHPDGGAADPSAGGAGHRRRRDQPRLHGRGVQQHGQGPARQDRGLVPHVLGEPVAAADVRHRAVLRAGPRVPEPGRRRRHHVRDAQLGRGRPRGDR